MLNLPLKMSFGAFSIKIASENACWTLSGNAFNSFSAQIAQSFLWDPGDADPRHRVGECSEVKTPKLMRCCWFLGLHESLALLTSQLHPDANHKEDLVFLKDVFSEKSLGYLMKVGDLNANISVFLAKTNHKKNINKKTSSQNYCLKATMINNNNIYCLFVYELRSMRD